MPNKNAWFEIWSFSLTAEDIEYSLPQTGDYTLTCTINVTATANFSSGLQSVKTASASANLPIRIEVSGITSLLCDIQVQVFK
jgi:RNA 3'-terminal phosphate cyclase